ncbi:MAG: DUF5348 domain-containing protein [Ktedonobacteraceae bacterium]
MDMEHEDYIGYGSEGYTIVNQQGHEVVTLRAGDTLELFIGKGWQRVQVESGGYKGWYYVAADGQPARFAVAMQIRGYQAALCLVAAPESARAQEQEVVHVHPSARHGKRVRRKQHQAVIASVETLPSGVQVLHLAKRAEGRKEQPA